MLSTENKKFYVKPATYNQYQKAKGLDLQKNFLKFYFSWTSNLKLWGLKIIKKIHLKQFFYISFNLELSV